MEELVTHLMSYGLDPDKAKLIAASMMLNRPPPVTSYGPATTQGYSGPERGLLERGNHGPEDSRSKGVKVSQDEMLNTALAGYSALMNKHLKNVVSAVMPGPPEPKPGRETEAHNLAAMFASQMFGNR